MKDFLNKYFPLFFIIAFLINIPGLMMNLLDQDSALYATIAKTILLKKDWFNLYVNGKDWLDKPHFPFWAEALSMKCFGINAFGYKLPSFLFWLIGCCYVYKVANLIYNKTVAQLSVIIYMTALHGILANFDVRAEEFLTTLTFAATYHLIRWNIKFTFQHFILAATALAMAVMTKGIFVGITIGGGLCWYLIWTGHINKLFTIQYAMFMVLIMLLCFPELYSLYNQFDLHPEKLVFNKHHVSGIKFFLWDSQFGRFFNTGPIKGEGDISFYLHTTLWAFLPWSLLLITAVWKQFVHKAAYKTDSRTKYITGTALISFLLFSFSKFQLPHYIIILFPNFAILTAVYIVDDLKDKASNVYRNIHYVVLALICMAVLALVWFIGLPNCWLISIAVFFISVSLIWFIYHHPKTYLLPYGLGVSAIISIFLFAGFYPFLFWYQAGMQAGKLLSQKYKASSVIEWKTSPSYLLQFYAPNITSVIETPAELKGALSGPKKLVLYTTPMEAEKLKDMDFKITYLDSFNYYRTTLITGQFINPSTRLATLEKRCLIVIAK